MQLVDTHCHLNFDNFSDDLEGVVARAHHAGVTRIIIPAVDLETCHEALALATRYEGVFVAIGVHPNSTTDFDDATLDTLKTLAQSSSKVVAIGEIGLDYYWDKSPKDAQARAFKAQLGLASALELPVIIHNREAHEDTLAILEAWANTLPTSLVGRAGVLHSFSAPQDIGERALACGFYLGFTGPLTFKKNDELRTIASRVPSNRLLIETDAPFLTPEPYRGKTNTPEYVAYVNDRLASIKGVSAEEMAHTTTENALRLFDKML